MHSEPAHVAQKLQVMELHLRHAKSVMRKQGKGQFVDDFDRTIYSSHA